MYNNNGEMLYSPEEEETYQDECTLLTNHTISNTGNKNSSYSSYCTFSTGHQHSTTNHIRHHQRSSSASDVMLPNIFVQIPIHNNNQLNQHTIRQQNREIKCEQIKSECDNQTQTPATSCSATPIPSNAIATINNNHLSNSNINNTSTTSSTSLSILTPAALVTARPKTTVKCYKCTMCPFISITQTALDMHTNSQHKNRNLDVITSAVNKNKVHCPGCDNVFYTKKSLKIHLINDHQMTHSDMMMLLAENNQLPCSDNDNHPNVETNSFNRTGSLNRSIGKQKIYLKNVEVLKNPILPITTTSSQSQSLSTTPQTTTTANDFSSFSQFHDASQIEDYTNDPDLQLIELIDDEFAPLSEIEQQSEQQQQQHIPNKIFVKNDNILKNPEAVNNQFNFTANSTFDYGIPSTINFNSVNENTDLNIIETPPPQPPSISLITPQLNNDHITPDNQTQPPLLTTLLSPKTISENTAPARKSCKIFIKNVDILKKPITIHPPPLTMANGNGMLFNNLQPLHQFFNRIELPILPSQTFGIVDNCEDDNSDLNHFDQSSSSTIDYRLSPPFSAQSVLPDSITTASTTINQPKKIFIKNIDILKNPVTSTVPSGGGNVQSLPPLSSPIIQPMSPLQPVETIKKNLLHLRTVDELNLMNITEVQNLIENFHEDDQQTLQQQHQGMSSTSSEMVIDTEMPATIINDSRQNLEDEQEENDEYNEIPENFLCITNSMGITSSITSTTTTATNHIDSNNHPFLENSIIHDFVTGDQLQFPIQCIQDNSEESFCGKSLNVTNLPPHFSTFQSNIVFDNGQHNSSTNTNVTTPTTTSSNSSTNIDKKTNRNDIELYNTTDDPVENVPLYYSTAFAENFSTESTNELSVPSSTSATTTTTIADYERAFSEEILFVDEIVQSNNLNVIGQSNNNEAAIDVDESEHSEHAGVASSNDDLLLENRQQKGRIYVVANLLKEQPSHVDTSSQIESLNGNSCEKTDYTLIDENVKKKKIKKQIGRPKGLRKIDLTIRNSDDLNRAPEPFYKCRQNCAMHFRSAEMLQFHERCHDPVHKNRIICPECEQHDFKVWNTLHTHLWRQHQIDMELYSCELCTFRTPILSRLLNTHMKIHSDERNFKCVQCDKAFKNTKQLKNHRRIHAQTTTTIHKCDTCDMLFYNRKYLHEHIRSIHRQETQYQCDICGLRFSSLHARTTHCLNHRKTTAKHRCDDCSYMTNDLNAYRRHRMTHTDMAGYHCKYCDFKSIQSSTYMKHIVRSHPQEADKIVFSCKKCTFNTINKRRYDLHVLNHNFGKMTKRNEGNMDEDEGDPNRSVNNVTSHFNNVVTENSNSDNDSDVIPCVDI